MEYHHNGDSEYVDTNYAYCLKYDKNKFTLLYFAVITFHGRVITFCENCITFRVARLYYILRKNYYISRRLLYIASLLHFAA